IYSPNYGILTPEHVNRAHELGMRVIPWTVNNKDDMQRMMELGVDGLITDYPNRFNELYRRRAVR
ncbi:MAG: glycerophosphodiester phosphodiesterase family protein, partial [Bacteroidota bacterium]